MIIALKNKHSTSGYRILSAFIAVTFIFSSIVPPQKAYAQVGPALTLPPPGTIIGLSPNYAPALIKGIRIHADDPLKFTFLINPGEEHFKRQKKRSEYKRMIKYFLASLTIPEENLWVNLSPHEQDRIVDEDFGQTEMGRDLLAQDYILKQLSASLMSPDNELGEKFWKKIRAKAFEEFGTTEVPIDTFNKVWIVPQEAVVYEHDNAAYVIHSHLKVLTDKDYVAMDIRQKSTVTSRLSFEAKHESNLAKEEAPARDLSLQNHNQEIEDGKWKKEITNSI